jgi:hypothetical protein
MYIPLQLKVRMSLTFWLKMAKQRGRLALLVVLVGFVVFVFSFGVCSYLSDSIGYQPHWLCLSLVFLKGITFD